MTTENLPATRSDAPAPALHAGHDDPQHQQVQQNIGAGLLPLALIILLVLSFAAAAWTFLAAQPA